MITKALSISVLLVGMTLAGNGLAAKANDILANAGSATGQANISQFRTALDLYYIDNGSYPTVNNGSEMVTALENGNYIRENAKVKSNEFDYQALNNGQNYSLEFKID